MTRSSTARRLVVWAALPVAGLAGVAVLAAHRPAAALVNESRSLPSGLYLRSPDRPIAPGAVVAIDQPKSMRGYLRGLGMPADVLLLKRVAARGGEVVCRDGAIVRTPDRTSPVLVKDRQGVSLPSWRGCRRLDADELFLLGDTPASFDSRYFGPVRRSDIRGVYRETMTW